jgi:hypothetical protein
MVVMIVRWKRHAAVSALALTGLLLLLLHIPVFMIIYASALQMLPSYPTSDDYQRLFLIIGLIFNVTLLVAYVPLLLAIFIKRRA